MSSAPKGGVRERNGKWTARIYRGHGRYEWLKTWDTEDEAWAAFYRAKERQVGGKETVGSFVERYVRDFNRTTRNGDARWASSTIRNMEVALRAFSRRFGATPLRALDVVEVRPWAASQPRNNSAIVRTMMNDAIGDGLCEKNPFSNLRLEHSRGRRDITVLTEAEVEEMLVATAKVWDGAYSQMIVATFATLAYTACRPGELAALRPSDIDLANNEVLIERSFNGLELKGTKTGSDWKRILPPPAAARIAEMPRSLHAKWLFTTKQGRQFRKSSLAHYWSPVRAAIGRPQMDLYELRHAGCTMLLERGASLEDVAHQMGHVGTDLVEKLYGHPNKQGKLERLKHAYSEPTQLRAVAEASN